MENSLIRARETTENNEKPISNFFGLSFLWINYLLLMFSLFCKFLYIGSVIVIRMDMIFNKQIGKNLLQGNL